MLKVSLFSCQLNCYGHRIQACEAKVGLYIWLEVSLKTNLSLFSLQICRQTQILIQTKEVQQQAGQLQ